ncbi:MAG: hypothetical protein DHS20C19_16940 [Acidimicrobiales bacterium]|nr:MAG: hypothetical protein DHS20C19_16940 [Acidimicrobiales bacterium]
MPALIRRTAVLAVAACLLLGACGDDETPAAEPDGTGQTIEGTADDTGTTTTSTTGPSTTTTPTGDTPDCVGADWELVDAGPFTFSRPADLVDQEVQGIDSLVGFYERDGMTAGFDFGWFSGNETERYPDEAETITLDGLTADFVQVDVSADPDSEMPFLVALYVPIPGGENGAQDALAFWVRYEDAADHDAAACMATSVDFT